MLLVLSFLLCLLRLFDLPLLDLPLLDLPLLDLPLLDLPPCDLPPCDLPLLDPSLLDMPLDGFICLFVDSSISMSPFKHTWAELVKCWVMKQR